MAALGVVALTSAARTPTGAVRYPWDHGAAGDGARDDTLALQRALDALAPGEVLDLGGGTFRHSDVLWIRTRGCTLRGPGTLLAVNQRRSALMVDAADVTVNGVTLTMEGTSHRWDALEQMKLALGPHSGARIQGVQVHGSAAAGILAYGATNFTISDVLVRDTRADGIHITHGSQGGQVLRPRVENPGDDGVAVVSYDVDPRVCRDMRIVSPQLHGQSWGRGFTVAGGEDVHWEDVLAVGSAGAAIYIACERSSYQVRNVERVTVTRGRIINANSGTGASHGSVVLFNEGADRHIQDVRISGLQISGTNGVADREIALLSPHPGTIRNVVIENITVEGNLPLVRREAQVSGLQVNSVNRAS